MISYLRPSTHRRTSANTRSTRFKRVGQPPLSNRLRLVESRMAPYHALSTCPLPCSEYLLNRLAAIHHLFHSLPSPPSSQHPQRLPSLGYPSIYLLLVKLAKTLLLDAFKLSSMAVPYLLSFGWGQNTSHKKWYKFSFGDGLTAGVELVDIRNDVGGQKPFQVPPKSNHFPHKRR
jgi:hypothetical protein